MGDVVTLKENKEFKRIYSKGKSLVSPYLVTYVAKNKKNVVRIGITTSKKIGNSVVRNRSRRVILAAFREVLPNIENGYDFVFVARHKTSSVKSYVILRHMKNHLKKHGVLNEEK